MGYFIIIVFTTFLNAPPELLPVAFNNNQDCINYLTSKVIKNYNFIKVEENNNISYLVNETNSKFAVCKKLEYPDFKNNVVANNK